MNLEEILKTRTLIKDDPECPTYLWPRGQQIISQTPLVGEIAMIEVHVKPDGSQTDEASFCFVLETPTGHTIATQITLNKLWPAIEAAIKTKGALS